MRRKWVQCVVAAIGGFLIRDERSCLGDGCPQLVHNVKQRYMGAHVALRL